MKRFQKIPDFELLDQGGEAVSNADFAGRYLILYFYPKADTPGCTIEAQDFTALRPAFSKLDATVVGVSPDAPESLCRFTEARDLKVTLLSDPDRGLAAAFGALKDQGGIQRSTFLMDRTGVLRWVWPKVVVAGHAEEVLSVVRELHEADRALNPVIQTRRARRAIAPKALTKTEIRRLLEAATLAPSCFNNQPWRFVVAQGDALEGVRASLKGGNAWALAAPVIIAVTTRRDLDFSLSDERDYFLFDTGMAAQTLMLQATQQGLYAHPMAGFDPPAAKNALGIPEDYTLITLIAVGRPGDPATLNERNQADEVAPRVRKPMKQVVAWNRFDFPGDPEAKA